jgi:alpha-mannosidase
MNKFQQWQMQHEIEASSSKFEYERIRIQSQLSFAGELCKLHPEYASEWQKLIAHAHEQFTASASCANITKLSQVRKEIEELLIPLSEIAKSYTVYCVGHAHIDMNWQWGWPETVALTNDTFSTVLQLMDEFPEFKFSQSQASCYNIIEKYNPELLERIKEQVSCKRWELTASHWVENDKNMVSGESLCRHLLYTRKYLTGIFGKIADDVSIDWAPDTFGHAATVPTYLAHGGITRYFCTRPGSEGNKPAAFWWEGKDNSRVLTFIERENYNGRIEPEEILRKLISFTTESGLPFVMHCFGVGDHGGGPTRQDLLYARDMQAWKIFPALELATSDSFYRRLEAIGEDLPTYSGELNVEFTGCYVSHAKLKTANRAAENALSLAEQACSTLNMLTGTPYPYADLEGSWQKVLFTHFHDILPGAGVADTRQFALGNFQEVFATTEMLETQALRRLAQKIDTQFPMLNCSSPGIHSLHTSFAGGAGFKYAESAPTSSGRNDDTNHYPFVLFNQNSTPYSGLAIVTLWDRYIGMPRALTREIRANKISQRPFIAIYPDGSTSPVQVVESGGYWHHEYVTVCLPVDSIPANGYQCICITLGDSEHKDSKTVSLTGGYNTERDIPTPSYPMPCVFENDFTKATINPETGHLADFVFKTVDNEFTKTVLKSVNYEFIRERPHPMTSWRPDHTMSRHEINVTSVEPEQRGPFHATVISKAIFDSSSVTTKYTMDSTSGGLKIDIDFDWREFGDAQRGVPVLNLNLPLATHNPDIKYSIPFGSIERPSLKNELVPTLSWVKVSDNHNGILIISTNKHGYKLNDDTLSIGLIRGSYDPDPHPEIGQHHASFMIIPFEGELSETKAWQLAQQFERPIRAISTDSHQGELPQELGFYSLASEDLCLHSIKALEDGNGLALRIANPTKHCAGGTIKFNSKVIPNISAAYYADVYENKNQDISFRPNVDSVDIELSPFALATICIEF